MKFGYGVDKMKDKYQLYLKKSGTKRWLKKGKPGSQRATNRRYKKYKNDSIHDVKMKLIR